MVLEYSNDTKGHKQPRSALIVLILSPKWCELGVSQAAWVCHFSNSNWGDTCACWKIKVLIIQQIPLLTSQPAVIQAITNDILVTVCKHVTDKNRKAVAAVVAAPVIPMDIQEQQPQVAAINTELLKRLNAMEKTLLSLQQGKGQGPHPRQRGSAATGDGKRQPNQKQDNRKPSSSSRAPTPARKEDRENNGSGQPNPRNRPKNAGKRKSGV